MVLPRTSERREMPKQKTHSGATKRLKVTATGKLLRRRAPKSHNLEKKSAKLKRSFRRDAEVSRSDTRAFRKLLGLGLRGGREGS